MKPELLELGGTGSVIHLAPANGFPPATYEPLFTRLKDHFRIVCVLPRALRSSREPPPTVRGSWESVSDDIIQGWETHRVAPVIALGHSFGAVSSLVAAVKAPQLVRALIMLDPTILTREMMARSAEQQRQGLHPRSRLVQVALKRKRHFSSQQAAFKYWRGKELFRDWPDEALDRYTRAMLKPASDGGWDLTWTPEWEAWYYLSFFPHTWEWVPRVDPRLPILAVGGETSDTFGAAVVRELREALPQATYHTVPGAGHLFPQSHWQETRALLEAWLAPFVKQAEVSVS